MRRTQQKPRRRRPVRCTHQPTYETDWLGRTYVGCAVCGHWKLLKTQPPPDARAA
ncbi:MAG TPA: hypothetical protein VF882_03855 [Gemmatimonadales bacterium]